MPSKTTKNRSKKWQAVKTNEDQRTLNVSYVYFIILLKFYTYFCFGLRSVTVGESVYHWWYLCVKFSVLFTLMIGFWRIFIKFVHFGKNICGFAPILSWVCRAFVDLVWHGCRGFVQDFVDWVCSWAFCGPELHMGLLWIASGCLCFELLWVLRRLLFIFRNK